MKYVLIFLLTTILGTGVWFLTPTKQPEQSFGGVSVFQGNQGGTGTSTASVGDIGKVLAVNSVNPLTYNFASVSSASSTLLSDFNNWSGVNNFTVTTTFGGSIMASGTTGVTPGSGPGTRLMWIPSKAALRFGTANGDEWNEANIGLRSTAFGQDSRATAADSSALGYYTTASGARCFAAGSGSTCKGVDSTSIGQNNYIETTGNGGTAIGRANSIFGSFGVAVGYQNVSEATGATTIGSGGDNYGTYSTLIALNSQYAPASKAPNLSDTLVVLGGNVDIGSTTYAPAVLTVSATSTSGQVMIIKGIASQTGNYFDIKNNNDVSQFIVKSSGFVGVGTSTPRSIFHVEDNTQTTTTQWVGSLSRPGVTCFGDTDGVGATCAYFNDGVAYYYSTSTY